MLDILTHNPQVSLIFTDFLEINIFFWLPLQTFVLVPQRLFYLHQSKSLLCCPVWMRKIGRDCFPEFQQNWGWETIQLYAWESMEKEKIT